MILLLTLMHVCTGDNDNLRWQRAPILDPRRGIHPLGDENGADFVPVGTLAGENPARRVKQVQGHSPGPVPETR
jgi:hypothetical protein